MFEAVEGLVTEHGELEQRLADPSIHADQGLAKRLNQRYAELSAIVRAYDEWRRLGDDIGAARELAHEDESFAEEAEVLAERRVVAEERLRHLLVPRDAADSKDALLEIKSGEGGEESALFAGDLLRMYTRYAERRGWKTEQLDANESDLGGYKSVTVAVKAKGTPEPGEAPYALLKFEGGVHRVQRVPVTESQGRVHTSAAGVLVMPEAEQVDVTIEEKDLRIDVFRSSGPGGQSVNTTDSAVRITHLPTGIVVSCQNEKSQLQNREQAMRILRARLLQAAQDTADAEASDARRSQVRTVDRSERIRTYNYPENRISDHRTGYKSYNLDAVLDGDLEAVIASCVEADLAARLDAIESQTCVTRELVRQAALRLADAGVASPDFDAAELLAHVLGTTRSRLPLVDAVSPEQAEAYDALVARRAAREPLQHLTGSAAFRYVELAVGPGVFVPRPETELLAGWAVEQAAAVVAAGRVPVVVDLCTGLRGDRARGRDRGAHGRGARRRARRPRGRVGGPQPRRHRGRPAARRHGRRVPRPRRHRRRRGLQPALHPARGLRVGRPRGPRPRPRAGAVLRRGRSRRDAGGRAGRGPPAAPSGVAGAEHADVQGELRAGRLRGDGPLVRRTRPPRTWQVAPAS